MSAAKPLTTSRLQLRPAADSDIPAWNWLFTPKVCRWLPVEDRDISSAWDEYRQQTLACWTIVRARDAAVIGRVGVSRDNVLDYWLGEPYWEQGYALEAVEAAVNWTVGHSRCLKLFAQTHRENLASQKILVHTGFLFTGLQQQHVGMRKQTWPVLNFALTCAGSGLTQQRCSDRALAEH